MASTAPRSMPITLKERKTALDFRICQGAKQLRRRDLWIRTISAFRLCRMGHTDKYAYLGIEVPHWKLSTGAQQGRMCIYVYLAHFSAEAKMGGPQFWDATLLSNHIYRTRSLAGIDVRLRIGGRVAEWAMLSSQLQAGRSQRRHRGSIRHINVSGCI